MKKQIMMLAAALLMACAAMAKKTTLIIKTNYGNMEMVLYDKTPLHKKNMIKLAKEHFFDSTLFHRVIPGFVIQGGDPASKAAKPQQHLGETELSYRVPAEFVDSYYHQRGAVGMARDDNPQKASSACQFYIVTGRKFSDSELDNAEKRSGHKISPAQREVYKTIGGTPHLDGGYTVFGFITKGMDVAEKIASLPRNAEDRPNEDARMLSVRIKKHFLFF